MLFHNDWDQPNENRPAPHIETTCGCAKCQMRKKPLTSGAVTWRDLKSAIGTPNRCTTALKMDCGNSGRNLETVQEFREPMWNFGNETWHLRVTIRKIYYKGTIVLMKYTTEALVYYKVAVAIADV